MKVRNVFGLMLSVVLLLVAAGSSLAREPQPTGPSEAVGVNASPAANAPWFNIEVDTPGDVGQYTSVAIDPVNNTTYVSYYDATKKVLRMAVNVIQAAIAAQTTIGIVSTWTASGMSGSTAQSQLIR